MKPRIGLTTTPATVDDRQVEQVNQAYIDAVLRAGAIPFVLPVMDPDDAELALLALDGLLLTGGGDVDPARYGADPVPEVYGLDPGRDAFEVALIAAAARAGLPVLGICRGSQILNVGLGGTLIQHVPAITGRDHCLRDRAYEPVHGVIVAPGSLLESVVGGADVAVNSLHHQAVDRLGAGLRAVAWAEDGIVEGVESSGGPGRFLGVQWHPELLAGRPAHERLFTWLVTEAAGPAPTKPSTTTRGSSSTKRSVVALPSTSSIPPGAPSS
ncbi:MAG TPA: gamma-glutamyl-gamma-aminobutyrate hydrolase family protein [Acidimicrobiia bacterium]|nr:gamma-glutamyl-gamma-aminobutyrate hydrolase family protein [Acidimicrobiia bacterium]